MPARLAVLSFILTLVWPTFAFTRDPSSDCANYDAWEWAQSELDRLPSLAASLDPGSDGIACEELPRGGFAPAWWTAEIPKAAVPAELVSIVDGDTLVVTVDGVEDEVRLYRSDAPEVEGCGGDSATEFTQQALAINDNDLTVYLETDATARDRYDRRLAYVWWEIDGRPYLLNEVLERSGWARDVDYGDRLYEDQFALATQFAERHQIGQYKLCGGLDAGSITSGSGQADQQPVRVPQGPGAGTCDPSYPDVCIPPIEMTGDLDCGQVEDRRFRVVPPDPHNLDGNHDGVGCEGN